MSKHFAADTELALATGMFNIFILYLMHNRQWTK